MLLLSTIVGLIASAGCQTSPAPTQSPSRSGLPETDVAARTAGLTDLEIATARKLYVTKCARCHKFYDPANYDDEEWHTWMVKMSKKSRLKPDQEELLSRYLGAFRSPRKAIPQP
jgi:hypothetical protein